MKEKKYYSVKETIGILGMSRATLYRWEKAGKLPEPKRDISNNRYYTEEEINKLKSIYGSGRGIK